MNLEEINILKIKKRIIISIILYILMISQIKEVRTFYNETIEMRLKNFCDRIYIFFLIQINWLLYYRYIFSKSSFERFRWRIYIFLNLMKYF